MSKEEFDALLTLIIRLSSSYLSTEEKQQTIRVARSALVVEDPEESVDWNEIYGWGGQDNAGGL